MHDHPSSRKVRGLIAIAGSLCGAAAAFLFLMAGIRALSTDPFYAVGAFATTGAGLALTSYVVRTVAVRDRKWVSPPSRFAPFRPYGAAFGLACTLIAVVALVLVLSQTNEPPIAVMACVLLVSVSGRVGWWTANAEVPALLPFDNSSPPAYGWLLTPVRWVNTATLLISLLGLAAATYKTPGPIATGRVITIALPRIGRVLADRSAIAAIAVRTERALAKAFVEVRKSDGGAAAARPELQEAMLELGAALSNTGVTRLPANVLHTDPTHLTMISYLSRHLADLDTPIRRRVETAIRNQLDRRQITNRDQLSKHAADYLLALHRQITTNQGQRNAESDWRDRYAEEAWNERHHDKRRR